MSLETEAETIPRVRRIEGAGVVEVFLQISPSSTRDDARGQFASMAAQALAALSAQGFSTSNIVFGSIHFASPPTWNWQEALASAWDASGPLPISALVQPPAMPFCFCTMQLHGFRSARQSGVWHGRTAKPVATTVLRAGARHLRVLSILPRAELRASADVVDMTYDMLAQAGHALTARGLAFKDVVRTWIYVRNIERNYRAVNQARNRYFDEQQIVRLPASTCVGGAVPGATVPVAMDLYAIAGNQEVRVESISPEPMGEATTYGSAFARGSLVTDPGRKTLLISGTASIDAKGGVVAVGDSKGQLDCMFGNVRGLLAKAGMDFGDAVSATAYLKHADSYSDFMRAAAASGLSAQLPTTVVVADICRPEWLCEIEMCAMQTVPS
jgi:enamine deaminase RidA (YjgF/YER057c/UK114 family)